MKPPLLPLALCAILGTTACATSYIPRRSPSLRMTMEWGSMALRKDGQQLPRSFLSSELVDATSDVPEAHSYAKTYRGLRIAGLFVSLFAVASAGTGAYYTLVKKDEPALGWGLFGSGVGLSLLGLALYAEAQPYLLDTINAYNDHVELGELERAVAAGSNLRTTSTGPNDRLLAPPLNPKTQKLKLRAKR